MKEVQLNAGSKTEKPGWLRRQGFIPGIIYGAAVEKPIEIKTGIWGFKRVLSHITKNTRINVNVGSESYCCVLKELQKDPVTGGILHFDLQTVKDENVIRLRIPVMFTGRNSLAKAKYVLHVNITDIYVAGRADLIPDRVVVGLEDKKPGDKITARDIVLPEGLRLLDDKNEIIAAVTAARELEAAS